MKHPFKYYLHDSYESSELAEFVMGQMPDLKLDETQFSELIGQPFYEVTLVCEFDDVTGKVEIVSVSL